MTSVDVVICVFALLLAVVGWRQGFIVGMLSLAGFALGAYAGARLAPLVLSEGSSSPYAPVFGLAGAMAGGALLAGLGEAAGSGVRERLWRSRGAATVDGVLGASLSVVLALGLAWIAGAVMLQTPGARELRQDIQRSEILSRLNGALPPSGPLLNAIARFDPFPRIAGPSADVAPPRAAVARDPQVEAAAASVVRITGTACGLGVEGTGWVAGPELVVTNAHVVAGQDDTVVQVRGAGERRDARVVGFDTKNDIAVLRVAGLEAPALELADEAPEGRSGAVLGFPLNGPYDVRAARLGRTQAVLTEDAYGRGPVQRVVTSFRGRVRPGNSGGPLVDTRGRVAATVFAATRGTRTAGGYAVPNSVVADRIAEGASRSSAVSTGPCAG